MTARARLAAVAAAVAAGVMAPAGAQDPSPEERTREVVELTELYFRTRGRGDLEGAHAMLSPALRESLPLDRYAAMWTDPLRGGRVASSMSGSSR